MALLLTLLTTTLLQAAPAPWSCTANGMEPAFNGGFGRRREVQGPSAPTLRQAQARAIQACMGSGLMACGVSGCSQLPFNAR
ncbi:MAG: hypothetical protein EOP11_26120 [Proteobacteria bacterium]|nr:MAG: hypothetical protein EOP11_26120 [Pseudomonadota bacterium]